MTHLRRYLEQTGAIAPEQLDAALRRQQIYGGSLDTVLLELDLVDPLTLNELLSQACGLPVVPPEFLESGQVRPWAAIPSDLIDIGWAVPLSDTPDEVLVAVHPDLPNERLGALYRACRRAQPMVTPECCLERLATERTGQVVPQRYAVISSAYLNALRRRPSETGSAFPLLPEFGDDSRPLQLGEHFDHFDGGLRNHALFQPWKPDAEASSEGLPATLEPVENVAIAPELDEDDAALDASFSETFDPNAEEPDDAPTRDLPRSSGRTASFEPEPDHAVPRFVRPESAEQLADTPPIELPREAILHRAPPIRYTGPIGDDSRLEAGFDRAEAARRMRGARAVLETAQTRDSALDALVQAAMVVTPRIALLRIRKDELIGLPSDRSAIGDTDGRVIPLREGSELEEAVAAGRWHGITSDQDLGGLSGMAGAVPCVLNRIDVAGRPVMLLYADLEGRDFSPEETNLLDELCDLASDTFEQILKSRRSAEGSGPHHDTPRSRGSSAEPLASESRSWGSPSDSLVASFSDDPEPRTTHQRLPSEPSAGASPRRETAVDGSPEPAPLIDDHKAVLTVNAMPPPPPIPPPPPMAEDEMDGLKRHQTLMGLPADSLQASRGRIDYEQDPSDSMFEEGAPSFVPPPLQPEHSGPIVSLAAPIGEVSIRGHIDLDDEDWEAPDLATTTEATRHRIDGMLRAIAAGDANAEDLRSFGEAGLMRLAAQFPGPLEILRRDLRALPPPSAHGPHVRAAITLGEPMVPHLLDLFDHPDADVRFYAAFVFQELRDPRCMRQLSELAFDHSGDVRVIAMRVLETYNRYPGFDEAVGRVRNQLDSSNRTRQLYAARAVGTLRDIEAIPKLVELLASKDRFIQEASLESLCSITGQQHGLKPHRWKQWYQEQGHRHRIEWIMESLRHRDLPVRRWASDELVRISGHRVPFSALGDKEAREVAFEAWMDWWESTGRTRFLPQRTGESVG